MVDIREDTFVYRFHLFAEMLINFEENQRELTLSGVSKKVDVNFKLVDFLKVKVSSVHFIDDF